MCSVSTALPRTLCWIDDLNSFWKAFANCRLAFIPSRIAKQHVNQNLEILSCYVSNSLASWSQRLLIMTQHMVSSATGLSFSANMVTSTPLFPGMEMEAEVPSVWPMQVRQASCFAQHQANWQTSAHSRQPVRARK